MTEEHIEPPQTIKEVGIHIGYMRQDISELKDLVKDATKTYATKEELGIIEGRVGSLEKRNGIKTTLLWVGLVASAIINVVGAANLFSK